MGSMPFLAGWFTEPMMANGSHPQDEMLRGEILGKCFKCSAWGRDGNCIAMKVEGGVVLAEVDENEIVRFDYNQSPMGIRRVCFWFNKSSVADLGKHLRSHPELKVTFDTLFTTGRALATELS